MVDFLWESQPGKLDPQILLELPQLQGAVPSGSQVNDDWLRCLAQVPQLRVLNLSGGTQGTATAQGLAELRSVKQLESLSLMGEWLHDETVAGVSDLKQLRSFSCGLAPNVTSAIFSSLQELTDLRELVILRAKQVDGHGTEHLQRLQNLRALWLFETSISDATLAHLSELTQLQWLDVYGTSVGDLGMESLATLTNLKRLNLDRTSVGDAGLEPLSRLPKLRVVRLGGTNVTDTGLPAIARMTQLESLHLCPVSITDDGLVHLRTLTNLKQLDVGPYITKEAANELRKALPGCRITRFEKNNSGGFSGTWMEE